VCSREEILKGCILRNVRWLELIHANVIEIHESGDMLVG
jgi:hypothetical protein